MREIKFRVWDGENMISLSKAFYDDLVGIYVDDSSNVLDKYFTEVELMQYAGLKDVNGVEIYEGDIIREHSCDEYLYAEVVFENGMFKGKECGHEPQYPILEWIQGEVIGNIYENKELL